MIYIKNINVRVCVRNKMVKLIDGGGTSEMRPFTKHSPQGELLVGRTALGLETLASGKETQQSQTGGTW